MNSSRRRRSSMKIGKVGIIGAGNMGSGIVQKVAQEGIDVVMIDIKDEFVQKGMENIRNTLAEALERKIFKQEQIDVILSRIQGTTELEMVADADIVIEAVFEDMDVKKDLFRRLDDICDDKTILASNTSSFAITELGSSTGRADRFVGLHFFYHPAKNRLLEIIPGRNSSQETLAKSALFSRLIGKIAINVADSPGFAVNRFFVPWLNESTRLLEEGVASIPAIDDVAKKVFGIGIGPFLLMNMTGVPIAYHSTVSLGGALGDFYAPSRCLEEQFEKRESWNLTGDVDTSQAHIIEERLLGCVLAVACSLLEEGGATVEDIDRGAKVGLRWVLGPFEMMNSYGIERSYETVSKFVDRYPGLNMPGTLQQHYDDKEAWSFNLVDLKIEGNIARVLINRPEAMNAINEEVIRQLDEQFTLANGNPDVKAIVLEGAGKAFIAGADIQYFIRKIKENKIDDICQFTRYGHDVLNRIDSSEKLVIAKLDGLALGGGAEIALAADSIVATEKASMGFPETGIGIYPGLGGTQRTTRYIGKELAKYLIFTGKILNAKTAATMGLVEHVASAAEIDERIKELVSSGNIQTKSGKGRVELTDDLKRIKSYFSDSNIHQLLSGGGEPGELEKKMAKTISYKAPHAIKLANSIIDEGSTLELKKGLELELKNLPEIFSTQDALEGLSSVIKRRRPTFTGK